MRMRAIILRCPSLPSGRPVEPLLGVVALLVLFRNLRVKCLVLSHIWHVFPNAGRVWRVGWGNRTKEADIRLWRFILFYIRLWRDPRRLLHPSFSSQVAGHSFFHVDRYAGPTFLSIPPAQCLPSWLFEGGWGSILGLGRLYVWARVEMLGLHVY
jgi:hypothetical protein